MIGYRGVMEENWLELPGYPIDALAETDKRFGAHARKRRELIGHAQAIVAVMMRKYYGIEWHQTVLSKIEAGERAVKLREAYALANLYWIPLDDLMFGTRLDQELKTARMARPGHSVKRIKLPAGMTNREVLRGLAAGEFEEEDWLGDGDS